MLHLSFFFMDNSIRLRFTYQITLFAFSIFSCREPQTFFNKNLNFFIHPLLLNTFPPLNSGGGCVEESATTLNIVKPFTI